LFFLKNIKLFEKEFVVSGIGFELVDLPTIFNENLFRVPDYQRGYSWQKKQVSDLLEDIGHLIKDGKSVTHFTGTLVLSRPDDSVVYHVVDGQQRLTTLSILISVVMEDVDKNERERIRGLYFSRGDYGSEIQVLEPPRVLRRLQHLREWSHEQI